MRIMENSLSQSIPAVNAEFYKVLCQKAAIAMVATDRNFDLVCWNEAAVDILGPDAQLRIGAPLVSSVSENRRKLLMRMLNRALQGLQTTQFEVQQTSHEGGVRDIVVLLSPIVDEDGNTHGVSGWVVDHTSHKQITDRLIQAEKMASLGTLASGVAHHFNNILGGVTTFVDYALSSGDETAMKRALQMTAEAAGRASKITQSLMSFAKQDQRRSDLADLTEVVLTFSHLVEKPLADKGILLELELRPASVVAVEANRMHQVLGNLLTNAEEAMPGGGQITLSIQPAGDDVQLSFKDNGCGIPKANLPMVFEPFFTSKGLLSGGQEGNPGLGLSVVHGIVVEMGGTIKVTSEYGKGSCFTMSFPADGRDLL